jgi:hypothetical protein
MVTGDSAFPVSRLLASRSVGQLNIQDQISPP